VVQFITVARIW